MRILGVDIGTTAVRAVEIESNFRRFEIKEYFERPLLPDESPENALDELVGSLPKAPDRIVLLAPTSKTTFRNLTLPTRDKKAIQAGIGFELEDDLPFELDDSSLEHTILGHTGSSTHLHVAVILRSTLQQQLDTFQDRPSSPDVYSTESWALRGLLNRVLPESVLSEPCLLVHLGAKRTILYVHSQKTPVIIREMMWGGSDLTDALSRTFGLPTSEAEKTKVDSGFVLPPSQYDSANARQKEFSDAFLAPVADLLLEIRQTLLSGKSSTHSQVTRIYLSGGPALMTGFAKLIEEELKLPVFTLQSMTQISSQASGQSGTSLGAQYAPTTDLQFPLALAAALTQIGPDRSNLINFRKGEFGKQGAISDFQLPALKGPVLSLSLILCLWSTSSWIKGYHYLNQLEQTQTDLERSVKAFFGQMSSSAVRTYLGRPSELKKNLTKEIDQQREMNRLGEGNPKSPLLALKNLSSSIGSENVVDLVQLKVGSAPNTAFDEAAESTATLTFIVSNPSTIEGLSGVLSTKFDAIQKTPPEEIAPSEGNPDKRYKITFTGKVRDDVFSE